MRIRCECRDQKNPTRRATPPQFGALFGEKVLTMGFGVQGIFDGAGGIPAESRRVLSLQSKYDAWLRHESTLSPQELRGWRRSMIRPRECAPLPRSAMRRGALRNLPILACGDRRAAQSLIPPMRICTISI